MEAPIHFSYSEGFQAALIFDAYHFIETVVTDFTLVPIVTHTATDDSYAVYKLEDYTDALAAKNILVPATTKRFWDRFYQIVGKPEEEP